MLAKTCLKKALLAKKGQLAKKALLAKKRQLAKICLKTLGEKH